MKTATLMDQLSMILPASVYQKVVEGIHPHVAKVLTEVLNAATPAHRAEAVGNAKAIIEHCTTVINSATKKK